MNEEKNKNSKVIYTAIFGGKDRLLAPKYVPDGFDFICFTDDANLQAVGPWQVRVVERQFDDPVRDARRHKILPHKHLSEYDVSVWIDGNIVVRGDVGEVIDNYLGDVNATFFDKKKNAWGGNWGCIYKEAEYLIEAAGQGKRKDDPGVIRKQADRYRKEGYPANNGLAITMIIFRRHNESDVRVAMEKWWQELDAGSRRDQMSFNYAAWKSDFDFIYLPWDSRDNPYFKFQYHPEHQKSLWQRIKRRISKK